MSLLSNAYARAVTSNPLPILGSLYTAPYNATSLVGAPAVARQSRAALLDVLLAYAICNDLYRAIGLTTSAGIGVTAHENIRSIRNPANQFVSFYVDNLWTNPQQIESENEALPERIEQLRKWSNWSHGDTPTHRASLAAFQFATFGELFIKTNQRADGRPYHVTIDPRYVDEDRLDLDERGYVDWIRIDHPVRRRDPATGLVEEMMRTEVWDREPRAGLNEANWPRRVRVWEYDKRRLDARDLTRLNDSRLIEYRVAGGAGENALPVEWVPIAYARFEVYDDDRGWSPLVAALEAIDEACRVATGSHNALRIATQAAQMLFSDNIDREGRPGPTPSFGDTIDVEVGGITMLVLPAGFKLADAIPEFAWDGIAGTVERQVEWVMRDLPELQFLDAVRDMADPSGRAIHYRLAPLLNRPLRARASAESAKILANQHALTLAQLAGVPGFGEGEIGTFEAGDFEHTFAEQPIIPRALGEEIADVKTLVDAGAEIDAAARVAGLSDEVADNLASPLAREQAATRLERERVALQADRENGSRLAAFRAALNAGEVGET